MGVRIGIRELRDRPFLSVLGELAPRCGISEEMWQAVLTSSMTAIQIIPQVELPAVEGEAMARIGQRDREGWPAVAGAIQFDCPVWTRR
jgi:hypothetical protein